MLQSELCCTLGQSVLEKSEPVLETAIHRRRIKDEETHFVPQIVFVLSPDNADSALKFLSINPEFAIQRYCGQSFDEPIRRMVNVALAREKLPAVPIGAHAVELLAHPPVRQIGGVVPAFGEQQRRSGVFLAFVITTRLGSDRELRKRTAC